MDVEVKKNGKNAQLKDHEVKELIKQSQNGDQQARDLLIEKNMRLVWSVVQRFLNRGYEPDDLFQIGCIGLENDGDPITLLDQIADNSEEKWFDKIALKEAISDLEEREKLIVYLRYYKDQTQSEVAERLGISQVQVSRLEKKILKQIKVQMDHTDG